MATVHAAILFPVRNALRCDVTFSPVRQPYQPNYKTLSRQNAKRA
jgi:hypothetical protein